MIQRVQTKQKQSPAGGLLSDTGRRRGGGQIALREGRREGGSAKLPGGGGGAHAGHKVLHTYTSWSAYAAMWRQFIQHYKVHS